MPCCNRSMLPRSPRRRPAMTARLANRCSRCPFLRNLNAGEETVAQLAADSFATSAPRTGACPFLAMMSDRKPNALLQQNPEAADAANKCPYHWSPAVHRLGTQQNPESAPLECPFHVGDSQHDTANPYRSPFFAILPVVSAGLGTVCGPAVEDPHTGTG